MPVLVRRSACALSCGAVARYLAAAAKLWGTRGLPGMDMGVSLVTSIGFLIWLGVTRGSRGMGLAGEMPESAV